MTVKPATPARTRTAKKPAPRTGRSRSAARAPRPQPRQELPAELTALEEALAEVLDRVGERLRTRLAGLSAAVTGPGGATLGARRITAMRKAIKAVNVQPAKGRVKDLVRLRELLDALQEQLASET